MQGLRYVNRYFVAIERGGQGGEPLVAQLDYCHESPGRVTSMRVVTTAAVSKLFMQINMDCLLDKEFAAGARTHATSQ